VGDKDLFVALRGERFDGHDFVAEAFRKGAWGALVDGRQWARESVSGQAVDFADRAVIAVDDTVRGLGDIAAFHRSVLPVRVVGITGSNGKTTTKEMAASVAGRCWRVHKNRGNFNNLIGLPLTVLELEEEHQVAVLEMGMNRRGEIRRLAEIARPEVGVVTNVGPVHLEHIGSVRGVAEAKAELLGSLDASGTAVVNADDPWTETLLKAVTARKMTFGLDTGADVRAEHISCREGKTAFTLHSPAGTGRVSIPFPGEHNVCNALAASAAACALGAGITEITEGLETAEPPPMRFSVMDFEGGTRVVNDAYNANPVSMRAALDSLSLVESSGRRAAVLGDMLELGEETARAHRQLGREASDSGIDMLIAVGRFAGELAGGAAAAGMKGERVRAVEEAGEAADLLREWIRPGDLVLIKGSRGVRLERVLQRLQDDGTLKGKEG
jgi:UDP-N-acetylmuramoyl-tripeptide--D-alanyl-D-alanine ligase